MNKKIRFLSAFISILLMSCGQKKTAEVTDISTQKEQVIEVGNVDKDHSEEGEDAVEGDSSAFAYYNEVERILNEWNEAISNHHPDALANYYATEVLHYSKPLSKAECIQAKTKWLSEHPSYSQKIEHAEVYFMESDTTLSEFIAEFDKVCTENNNSKTVHAYLYFKQENGAWKITGETDDATELSKAKKTPANTIKNGESEFYRGYWADTRGISGFAHDMVPYRFSLSLNVDRKITGSYYLYSGTMREMTHYLIVDGQMENGTLTLTVVYNENEQYSQDDYPKDTQKEKWHFKIINGNKLVCLDKDNGYLYAKSLLLVK